MQQSHITALGDGQHACDLLLSLPCMYSDKSSVLHAVCVSIMCDTHTTEASERTKNIPCSISVQSGDNLIAEQTF